MEILFAYIILLAYDLCAQSQYEQHLHKAFLASPDSELLLELEECSGNIKESFARINRYFRYESSDFDVSSFGRALCFGLEAAYKEGACDIKEFGERCYGIWWLLPPDIQMQKPFDNLSYADDYLSFLEDEAKKLYEETFEFYRK